MSTHYTAGGMPLAFTQEDFLVFCYRLGPMNLLSAIISLVRKHFNLRFLCVLLLFMTVCLFQEVNVPRMSKNSHKKH